MSRITVFLRTNTLGVVAIVIALSAGAYAADRAPKDSVVSSSIKNGQVKTADLKNNAVDGTKVKDNSLTGADVNESTLDLPASGGTVTSITAGPGLEGGPITSSGTLRVQSCSTGQVLKASGLDWACESDADTDTTYVGNPAAGIELSGNSFGLKSCPVGQVLKATAVTGQYSCASDEDTDTTYSVALNGGITLGGNTFGLMGCSGGQVLKATGGPSQWGCAADADTNTTYSAGSGLQLAGTTFSIPTGGVGGTQIADDSITGADLGPVRTASLSGGNLANGSCAGIDQNVAPAAAAPGADGDFTLTTTVPAMPLGVVVDGRIGPVISNNRHYYMQVCNLTGATVNLPAATIKMLIITS